MQTTIKPFDIFGNTQALDIPILDAVATRLEARGKHPTFKQMSNEYLSYMNIDSVQSVLDLGCGTGFAAREIAARSGFKGRVVGIDISPYLIDQAKTFATDEGCSDRIEFQVGDTRRLEFSDNSFDSVVAHTLVSHLPDPLVVINEMVRVVKPEGLIGIFDGDYASLTFSHSDAQQGKEYDELIINSIVTQPRVMRQLPLLLSTAGLEFVTAYAYVVSDISTADYWATSVEAMRKLLPAAKAMAVEEASAWANARMQESEAGTFFASSNYYSYVARKPNTWATD
jgi:ubiquinone/menaquinone biosynthesis C-methylase UbiE